MFSSKKNFLFVHTINYVVCNESNNISYYTPENRKEFDLTVETALLKNQKVKIIGQKHTANQGLCFHKGTSVISTKYLKDMEYDSKTKIVKIDSGVTYGELGDYLNSNNRALDIVYPGFTGISIAGALGTGAHGSSMKNVSTLADQVVALDVIYLKDGKVINKTISAKDKFFNAWLSNLGSLGAISRIHLKTVDQYVLHTKVSLIEEEVIVNDKELSFLKDCDFAQFVWMPGLREIPKVNKNVLSFCGIKKPVESGKSYTGSISFVDFEMDAKLYEFSKSIIQFSSCQPTLSCTFSNQRYYSLIGEGMSPRAPLFDGKNHTLETEGLSWKMMASELSSQGIDFPQLDFAIGIDASNISPLVSRLNKIRKEWREKSKLRLCVPFSGFFFRFGKADKKTPLSPMSDSPESNDLRVVVDFVVYNPLEFSLEDRKKYHEPWIYIANDIVNKFSGKPHLAKNTTEVIKNSRKNWSKDISYLKEAHEYYDSNRSFTNQFSENLLYNTEYGH